MSDVSAPSRPPHLQFETFGPVDVEPLSRMQQVAARHLTSSVSTIPHVTHHDDIDVTLAETWRQASGTTSLLAVMAKAVARALDDFPRFSAALDSERAELILKRYRNIGFAIDTPRGLMVGVIRDLATKSAAAISTELADMAERARHKGLPFAEMTGGCFTISSLGRLGGAGFTPIINAPEVAILGVSRTGQAPFRAPDGGLEWRLMLPLSLSYDHRVINGAEAGRFIDRLAQLVTDRDFLDQAFEAA